MLELKEVSRCLGGTSPYKKQEHVHALVLHNEDDYRRYLGLDETLSVMPIDHADTYLSEKEQKFAIVVMWSTDLACCGA